MRHLIGMALLAMTMASASTARAAEEYDPAKVSDSLKAIFQFGSVATKLLTGLGVRVSDVRIGAGPGEKVPLLDLKRVEVKAALLRAIRSKGKDVEIHSAEVEGLTVNVVRLDDGTTNLERLQAKLAEQKKPEEEKKDEGPADLSFLRVDHFALTDGKISFIDESGDGAAAIVERDGLKQTSDTGAIDAEIDKILAANADKVEQYKAGKEALFGFFVGQTMKAMQGKANPQVINERLKAKLA